MTRKEESHYKKKPAYPLLNERALEEGYVGDHEEYEVFVEEEFIGALEDGEFRIMIWDRESFPGSRLLNIKVPRQWLGIYDISYEKEPAATGLPPASEFISLCSVYFGTRMRLGSVVRSGDTPYRSDSAVDIWIPMARQDKPNLGEASGFLGNYKALQPEYQQAVLAASKFYRQSLELASRDYELAYLALVNAIECMASAVAINDGREDWLGEIALELMQLVLKKQQSKAKTILLQMSSVRRKMLLFCQEYTTDDYFLPPPQKYSRMVTKNNLKQYVNNLYIARSAYVHGGTPLGSYLNSKGDHGGGDLAHGLPMTTDGGAMREKDLVPFYHAVARLVRCLILSVVRRHSS